MLTRQRKIEVLDSAENEYAKQECHAELEAIAVKRFAEQHVKEERREEHRQRSLVHTCASLLSWFREDLGMERTLEDWHLDSGAGYLARFPLTVMYLTDLYRLVERFKIHSGVLNKRWILHRLGLARAFYLRIVLTGVDPIDVMKEFEIQHAQLEAAYPREAINRIALRVVCAKTFDVEMLSLALVVGEGKEQEE